MEGERRVRMRLCSANEIFRRTEAEMEGEKKGEKQNRKLSREKGVP